MHCVQLCVVTVLMLFHPLLGLQGPSARAVVTEGATMRITANEKDDKVPQVLNEGKQFLSQVCEVLNLNGKCQPYPGKLVTLVAVNHEMIDFFVQWHTSASKFLDASCMHLKVMAADEDTKRSLTQLSEQNSWDLDIDILGQPTSFLQLGSRGRLPYGTTEYFTLVDRRARHVQDLLKQGCTTFMVDVDTIWKKNPFMEIIAQGKGQNDWYGISDDREDRIKKYGPGNVRNFCGCFNYVNPTATSLSITGKWIQKMQDLPQSEQKALSHVLKDNPSLKQKVTVLPREKFPPGISYPKFKQEAYIAHANWLMGHEEKVKFFEAVAEGKSFEIVNYTVQIPL